MKKIIIIFLAAAAILACTLLFVRYEQYFMAYQANQKISVGGIKLMMPIDEARHKLGNEEEFIHGFGGYKLAYPSKGIVLTLLDDEDTDFYDKVNEIRVTGLSYEVYGIKVGDEYDKALIKAERQGFTHQKDGYAGFWKKNMYMELVHDDDKVGEITIGINDRVASKRHY